MPTPFANAPELPYIVRYNATTNAWPARPSTTRTVFWLALSESAPDPAGLQAFDLVIKGPIS